MASAAFFIASLVAAAASLAATLCCLLYSSSLVRWSFILALKSETDLSHHVPKSFKKPRFSASGGGGCAGSVKLDAGAGEDGSGGEDPAGGVVAGPGAGCATFASVAGAAVPGGGVGLFWASANPALAAISAVATTEHMVPDRNLLEFKLRRLTATPSW